MENKLKSILDNLNEQQVEELLEKNIDFDIDKKALDRIKTSVYKKTGVKRKSKSANRRLIACAAVIALVFATMSLIGFDRIAAAVQQVIEYIPGFGKYSGDNEDGLLEIKVMKEPAFLELQGEQVEIHSSWLRIYKDKVIVTAILRYPQNIDLDGKKDGVVSLEYNNKIIYGDQRIQGYSQTEKREIMYGYTIKRTKTPINTLIFKTDNSEAVVSFDKPENMEDRIISQNFNGIIINAIPLDEKRSKFILTSSYEKNLESVQFSSSLSSSIDIKAVDEKGNEYNVKKSTSFGNEYYVEGDIQGRIVSLKFNRLYQFFTFRNHKSLTGVKFKTPGEGEVVEINKTIDTSVGSLLLKTVETIPGSDKEPANLLFTYEMNSMFEGLDISYMALYVEKTGGVIGSSPREKHREGDRFIIKHGVIADEKVKNNTVTVVPRCGIIFFNEFVLDRECILNLE